MSKVETSVIVPCYNVEQYIKTVISQLKEQSYQKFEVIFVNDGSTDNTKKEIETQINNFENYHIYTIENSGAANARNLGIKKAIGEYIYFFDADDKINPSLLEKGIQQIKKDRAELLIFGYYANNTHGRVIYKGGYKSKSLLYSNKEFFSFINVHFFENNLFSPWNKIYCSQFLKKNELFFPSVSSSEDALFNLELFHHLERVSISNERLYEYTVGRSGSLQSTKSSAKFKEDYEVCKKLKHLASLGLLEENIYYSYLVNTIYKYFEAKLISEIKEIVDLREILEKKITANIPLKTKIKLFILKMKWEC